MLQVQQQLIEGIQSQLESNPPLPEQFSSWADHPVTIHFLNAFRYAALDKEIKPYINMDAHLLARQISLNTGYCDAVEQMEELVESYRKQTEGDEDE